MTPTHSWNCPNPFKKKVKDKIITNENQNYNTPDYRLLGGSHTRTLHMVALHSTSRWSDPFTDQNPP